MASGTIAHFGIDQCFRRRVLESAGFQVADCVSLEALSDELLRDPDALILEEEPIDQFCKAIYLSRSFPEVPLILFESVVEIGARSADLTIPSFTAPELWLRDVEDLVDRSHAVIAESHRIHAESVALINDCKNLTKASQQKRQLSRQLRRHPCQSDQ